MNTTDIEKFFEMADINYKKIQDNIYSAGFPGETHLYEVWIRLTEGWIFFFIGPLTREIKEEETEKVSLELARLNYEITFAKVYLSPEDEVVISIELPEEVFTFELFEEALKNLVYYGEKVHYKLKKKMEEW
ncbi:MAG: hypothetical protein ACTSYA_01375 [Candidatus Kariarchaeaceae archaeon]